MKTREVSMGENNAIVIKWLFDVWWFAYLSIISHTNVFSAPWPWPHCSNTFGGRCACELRDTWFHFTFSFKCNSILVLVPIKGTFWTKKLTISASLAKLSKTFSNYYFGLAMKTGRAIWLKATLPNSVTLGDSYSLVSCQWLNNTKRWLSLQ